MCEVNWELVARFVAIFVSWPVAIVAVLAIVNWKYGTEVRALINRVRGLGWGSGYAHCPPQEPPKEPAGALTRTTETEPTRTTDQRATATVAQTTVEQLRARAIEKIVEDPNGAARDLEQLHKFLHFETIYHLIFGSQFDLLEFLIGAGRCENANLGRFHKLHLERTNQTGFPFDKYLRFLADTLLIQHPLPGYSEIAPKGREFVAYIRSNYGGIDRPW